MSTATIEQDIKDSIAKNLPAQVGEVLKSRLEQADKDSKEVERLRTVVQGHRDNEVKYCNDITALKSQLQSHDALDKREKDIATRELRIEVELLKKDVACEQKCAANLHATIQTVFRNPTYQETHFETSSQPVTSNGFTTLQHAAHTNTTTKKVD